MTASERHHLIPSRKVEGATVYGSHRQKLGNISNVIIDKASGLVAYVDLSTGGFLGFGNRHHRVRWDALRYEPRIGGYLVEADLQELPAYDEDPAVGGNHPHTPAPVAMYDTQRRHWM